MQYDRLKSSASLHTSVGDNDEAVRRQAGTQRFANTKLYCLVTVTEARVWTTSPESLPGREMAGSHTRDLLIASPTP